MDSYQKYIKYKSKKLTLKGGNVNHEININNLIYLMINIAKQKK